MTSGPVHYWRLRARLAVRGSSYAPVIGLFRRNTHQVVPIPDCVVHHPRINRAMAAVSSAMKRCGVVPYKYVNHYIL